MVAASLETSVETARPTETMRVDEATPAWAEALQQDRRIWRDLLTKHQLPADESLRLFPSVLKIEADGAKQRIDLTGMEFRDRLGAVEKTLNEEDLAGLKATLDAMYTIGTPASKPDTDDSAARDSWQKLLEQHVDVTLITASLNALIKRAAADPQAIASEWDFTNQLFATPEDYQTWLSAFTQYKDQVVDLARRLDLGTDVPLTDTELKIVALILRLGIHNARAFAHLETTEQKVE